MQKNNMDGTWKYGENTELVVSFSCGEVYINVPGFDPYPRENLIGLVIGLDILLLVIFIWFVAYTEWQIILQGQQFDDDNIQITDNSVRFTNLPSLSEYNKDSNLLRAALWQQIMEVVAKED